MKSSKYNPKLPPPFERLKWLFTSNSPLVASLHLSIIPNTEKLLSIITSFVIELNLAVPVK